SNLLMISKALTIVFSLSLNLFSLVVETVPTTFRPVEFNVIFAVETELIQNWKSLVGIRVDNPSSKIYIRLGKIYICLIGGSNTRD
ncbi:MAG: hypothetical protein ACKPKO_54805, partial [Candidatus Fonsibacter sp.]